MLLLTLGPAALVALLRTGERGVVSDPAPFSPDQWAEITAPVAPSYDDVPAFSAPFQSPR